MASTLFLGLGKSNNSYTVNNSVRDKELSPYEDKMMSQLTHDFLSSSLSTNYASSFSSQSSDDELNTILCRNNSTDKSEKLSIESGSLKMDHIQTKSTITSSAISNEAFVLNEEDVTNNNSSNDKVDKYRLSPTLDHNLNANNLAQPMAIKAPDNSFLTLYVNGKGCNVMLNATHFCYEEELTNSSTCNERVSIKLDDIISVRICKCTTRISKKRKVDLCPCLNSDSDNKSALDHAHTFIVKIFYAVQNVKQSYKMEMLTISTFDGRNNGPIIDNGDNQILVAITHQIRNILDGFDRPKRLLMFINPFGGGKNGKKIFDDKIKAMLELARVEFTVIVTERANHAKDMILDQKTDLNKFDGIVCVGGDGMFGEVLNGVLVRTQRENQIDYSSVDCVPKKPAIKLGVIPAGSTDAVVYATCGNKNPTNSIISILLGRKINIDVGAVHDHGGTNLIRYTASFMGYGFFGDTIHDSEQNRWLGTKRYDWAGLKKFFNHRLYNGEIKLCIEPSDGSPKDFNPCRTKCDTCYKAGLKSREKLSVDDSPACISIRGRFLAINVALVSCRCGMSKYGMSPMAHVGNGCCDLILISKCSRLDYFRYLISLAFSTKSPFKFNFVDSYRIREFEFNPIIEPQKRKGYTFEKSVDFDYFDCVDENDMDSDGTIRKSHSKNINKSRKNQCSSKPSVWNCDGEVVNDAGIHVKIHCQLVSLFAPGFDVDRLISHSGGNYNDNTPNAST